MDWQPIETAPTKQWENFLGWKDGDGVRICFVGYHHEERRFYDAASFDDFTNTIRVHPTHWMPLPSPPRSTGDDE